MARILHRRPHYQEERRKQSTTRENIATAKASPLLKSSSRNFRGAKRAAQQISVKCVLESAPIEAETRETRFLVGRWRAPARHRERNQRKRRSGCRLQRLQRRDQFQLGLVEIGAEGKRGQKSALAQGSERTLKALRRVFAGI